MCRYVAGATGLVGSRLVSRLSAQGHTVRVLTRNPDKARSKLPYARLQFFNIGQQLPDALKGATGVVNLAGPQCIPQRCINACYSVSTAGHQYMSTVVLAGTGEPIATRWSASLKREIKASRVNITAHLAVSIRLSYQHASAPQCI